LFSHEAQPCEVQNRHRAGAGARLRLTANRLLQRNADNLSSRPAEKRPVRLQPDFSQLRENGLLNRHLERFPRGMPFAIEPAQDRSLPIRRILERK